MASTEAEAARRRAELLWQQTRQADKADKVAAHQNQQAAQNTERLAIDAKTARLRALRLSKEAAERAAADAGREKGRTARDRPRRRAAAECADG